MNLFIENKNKPGVHQSIDDLIRETFQDRDYSIRVVKNDKGIDEFDRSDKVRRENWLRFVRK